MYAQSVSAEIAGSQTGKWQEKSGKAGSLSTQSSFELFAFRQ